MKASLTPPTGQDSLMVHAMATIDARSASVEERKADRPRAMKTMMLKDFMFI